VLLGLWVLSTNLFCPCLLNDLPFEKVVQERIMKGMNISNGSSYYIFCGRNKPCTDPELLAIEFLHSSYLFTLIVFDFTKCQLSCDLTSKTILHCHASSEVYYCNYSYIR